MQGQLQGHVELAAERGEDGQADLAGRISEGLDQDGPVVGDRPSDPDLAGDVVAQGRRGGRFELAFGLEPVEDAGVAQSLGNLPAEDAHLLAQLGGPGRAFAPPEGHHRRVPLGPRDHDLVRLDRLDPPGRRPQHERLADPPLQDKLLVQLAEPGTILAEEEGILAGVGDRPAAGQGQSGRAGQGAQAVPDPIPAHPGLEVPESRCRESARDQLQDALERLGREVAIRVGPTDQVEQSGDVPGLDGHAGHDLLGQDVEAVGRDPERLDLIRHHRPGQGGRLHQVGRGPGDHPPLADPADHVARPADPLEPSGDPAGRADLADQVDGPHVDPQLQGGRRDHARQLALLQRLLGLPSLLLAQAPVMRPCDDRSRRVALGRRMIGLGQLVEMAGEPLHDPSIIGEDDGRAMFLDQVEQLSLDHRPDRPFGPGRRATKGGDHAKIQLLALAGVHDRDRPGLESRRPRAGNSTRAAEESGNLLQWSLGGREADPHETGRVDRLQSFQQEGQEDASLVGAERMDLVDDDVRKRIKRLTCPTGEHEVQRFGRRDEDVGRLAKEPLPILLRRVARPDG